MTTRISKISVRNRAAFVMNFDVSYNDGNTGQWVTVNGFNSGDYPVFQERTLDLTGRVPPGAPCRPLVHAVLGGNNHGADLEFDPTSARTATYEVTGTTLIFSVTLDPIIEPVLPRPIGS